MALELRRLLAGLTVGVACSLAGCGGGADGSGAAASGGEGNAAASGGAGGSTAGTGGTVSSDPDVLYATFLPETEVGQGPALVSFHNETDFIQSLWLADAAFAEAKPDSILGPAVTASSDVLDQTTTGKHDANTCVVFHLGAYDGPPALAAGKSYTMSVALDDGLGFVGTLEEARGPSFIAVRAKVQHHSANAGAYASSVLSLKLGDGRGQLVKWKTYDENPTTYVLAGTTQVRPEVRFTSTGGTRYAAGDPVELDGAPGYTVIIDDEPMPGTATVVALHRL